ncbi:helix-turn-helix transcriptional regulator [Devosia sediminis]|uniref:Helix-turn-helix transcriptional regulator n=1 Tax=Devosia sediminis TaxID=2798801 RepID=A0A934IS88_9HYPH|nr:helix-turn-helix transcriptional regulator [Devosia sediminis]MBJ3785844.1 helix-turn-helix transcriptional regulator [Devosia sediminis]
MRAPGRSLYCHGAAFLSKQLGQNAAIPARDAQVSDEKRQAVMSINTNVAAHNQALGDLLRAARLRRRMSQLDLALTAGISQRHLGFVELGRASPSRELLSKLLDALESSQAERSFVYLAAGFTVPAASQDDALERQTQALQLLTRQCGGIPLVVFDHTWTTLGLNGVGLQLARFLMPRLDWSGIDEQGGGLDMIAATAHPDGLLSQARHPAKIASALLARFEGDRYVEPGVEERIEACCDALGQRFGDYACPTDEDPWSPIDLCFDTEIGPLTFVTMQCLMTPPHAVSLKMPRMELWLPADNQTRNALARASEQFAGARPAIAEVAASG